MTKAAQVPDVPDAVTEKMALSKYFAGTESAITDSVDPVITANAPPVEEPLIKGPDSKPL